MWSCRSSKSSHGGESRCPFISLLSLNLWGASVALRDRIGLYKQEEKRRSLLQMTRRVTQWAMTKTLRTLKEGYSLMRRSNPCADSCATGMGHTHIKFLNSGAIVKAESVGISASNCYGGRYELFVRPPAGNVFTPTLTIRSQPRKVIIVARATALHSLFRLSIQLKETKNSQISELGVCQQLAKLF